ncbi:MAG: hypothetical protein DWP98_12535 [Bacteroidetes bacterium]|nr:MAG: hypothetical protein DWP98_12535 [Bacteroidota bacterium]MBL1145175.1 hypothetical protein [Bacteroidota bacterium]NOG57971.1 hypothetical protein [Bacteroidota bacterium]
MKKSKPLFFLFLFLSNYLFSQQEYSKKHFELPNDFIANPIGVGSNIYKASHSIKLKPNFTVFDHGNNIYTTSFKAKIDLDIINDN